MKLPIYEPDPEKPGFPYPFTISKARRPQYFYSGQPYLGFVPLKDVFEGPIFGRFHGTRPTFAEKIYQQSDLRWVFDKDLAESWIRVEYAITIIAQHFYNPLRPLDYPMPSYPCSTKYYEPKDTQKRALDSVMYAQKLMLFLIAELRHNIAISPRFKNHETTWHEYLGKTHIGLKMDKEWLADLVESSAMTTVNLSGYFVDPSKLHVDVLKRLRRYSSGAAPLYIVIGKIDRTDPYSPKYWDTLDENTLFLFVSGLFSLQEAHKRIQEVETSTQNFYIARELTAPSPNPSLFAFPPTSPDFQTPHYLPHPNDNLESPESPLQVEDPEDLPPSLPNSGQPQGKWWFEFLQERREVMEEVLRYPEYIDEEEMSRNIQYEEYYTQINELPPHFHAVVYAWRPTPLHPQYLLRTPLQMSEVRAYWSKYPPSHRIYDKMTTVWDLYDPSCDLNKFTRDLNTLSVEDVEPTEIEAGVGDNRSVEELETPPMPDLADDRRKTAQLAKKRLQKTRESQLSFGDYVEYSRHRYGLVLPPKNFHFNHSTEIKGWLYLGFNLHDENLPHMKTISLAIESLISRHSSDIRQLYDVFLHPRELINDHTVQIQRFPQALYRSSEGETTRNLYLLRFPRSKKDDWVMGLNSAANLVLALREKWTTQRTNLVRNFLRPVLNFKQI